MVLMHGRHGRRSWIAFAAAIVLLSRPSAGFAAPQPERTDAPPAQPPTTSISGRIALYVGYFDTHHPANTRPKPDPWKGSPGVVFVGKSDSDGGWDSACLRLDNLTDNDIDAVAVTVDIGVVHFALWGTHTIPEHGKLILAQTAFENFDGSDTNEAGCYSCKASDCLTKVSSTIPVITVKVGSTTARYLDRGQVLNTRGVDAAGCPYTGSRSDESQDWSQVLKGSAMLAGADGVPRDSTALPGPIAVELAAPTPNPARGSVMFRFRLPVAGAVRLGMYDVAGRLVRTCVDADLDAGEYLRGLDLGGIEPGVYFGVLRAPGGVARRSFVVAR